MAKFKAYDYRQRVFVPVSLEDQLLPGTLEFALHTLVETRLDTSGFEQKYRNDETGRTAYDPKILLKIVLLGYARGIISSRKIEQACRENVVFIALACGQQPDRSTIATFVSSMKAEILPLFRDVLSVCQEMDLLGGTFFALDGLKLPSDHILNLLPEVEGTLPQDQGRMLRVIGVSGPGSRAPVPLSGGQAHRHFIRVEGSGGPREHGPGSGNLPPKPNRSR
jgi:transposase